MTDYVGDIEGNGLYDEITRYHCLVFKPIKVDKFFVFCDETQMSKAEQGFFGSNIQFFPLALHKKLLDSPKTTGIVIHNAFGFDLPVLNKLSGINYDAKSINGRPVDITDSLVLSRYLNPERRLPKGCPTSVLNVETGRKDRIGPHGLAAWGWRTGVAKPTVNDWSNQPLHVYVDRCIEDVKINEFALFMMQTEMADVAISNGSKKGDWETPLKMCQSVYHLMNKQERTGVLFDIEGAEKLLVRVDKEMSDIELEVEPTLGERKLPSGKQPTPPTSQWKRAFDYDAPWTKSGKLKKGVKDYLITIGYTDEDSQVKYIKSMYHKDEYGDTQNDILNMVQKTPELLTTSAVKYCQKFGITDPTGMISELDRIAKGGTPKILRERLKLKHKKDVKEFLVRDGWSPTIWKYRNIIVDKSTKQNLPDEEVEVKYQKYIKEFYNSVYWPFILKDLGYKNTREVDITTPAFKAKVMKKGRGLMSSPQYKDQRGETCVNLKTLLGETSLKIIKWLSLQNRRTTIKSFDKDTGWLNHPRLQIDGRLPARASGVTPTSRQKHSVVVNVPKPDDAVVLGKEMRGLFIAPSGWWNIGVDASGIEARVAGHYAYYFDNGTYANELLIGDVHSKNAKAYSERTGREITRSAGKNLTYAIMYGASGKKIALMASVDDHLGQVLIDAFWDANEGLKQAREALEQYWEASGKKYVMGIDGRKIFTRSKHSLMNSLFQSTGAIIIDFAGCWAEKMIVKEGLQAERWGVFHDEYQWYQKKNEVEEALFVGSPELELPMKKDKPQRDKDPLKPDQIHGAQQWGAPVWDKEQDLWVQRYSRVGELVAKGMEAAGRYYKMNLPFPGEYLVGSDWSECH